MHDNMANCLFILSIAPCLFALLYFPLPHISLTLPSSSQSGTPHLHISLALSLSRFIFSLSLRRPRSSSPLSSLSQCPSSLPHLLPSPNPLFTLSSLFLISVRPCSLPQSPCPPRLPSSLPLLCSLSLPSRALQCGCVGDDVRDAAAGVSNSCVYIRVLQPCGLQPLSG